MDGSFWHMSGYAPYVWGSFGFTAATFAWNLWVTHARRKRLFELEQDE